MAINEHTGDELRSGASNDQFRENYDKIFRSNKPDAGMILSTLQHLREQNKILREENEELADRYESVMKNLEKLENLLIELKSQIK